MKRSKTDTALQVIAVLRALLGRVTRPENVKWFSDVQGLADLQVAKILSATVLSAYGCSTELSAVRKTNEFQFAATLTCEIGTIGITLEISRFMDDRWLLVLVCDDDTLFSELFAIGGEWDVVTPDGQCMAASV